MTSLRALPLLAAIGYKPNDIHDTITLIADDGSSSLGRTVQQETTMAKGQMRGNRELKKPKKKKEAPAPATASTLKGPPLSIGTSAKNKKK